MKENLAEEMDREINLNKNKSILFDFEHYYVTYSAVAAYISYFENGDLKEKLERIIK